MKDLSFVMDVFATHHGMATPRMLAAAGMSRRTRQRLTERGIIEMLYERVVHIVSSPMTLEARCAALCLAYPQGFITGPTAGKLTGLRRMPNVAEIHFSVPHGSSIGRIDGVRLRQTTRIRSTDIVRRPDGINIASPPRLSFDLACDLSVGDLASVIEQVVDNGACTFGTIARLGRELVHPARRGSTCFVEAITSRTEGPAAQSHIESELGRRLTARGIPVVRQHADLRLPNRTHIRLDLAVPSIRWGIEIDLHPHHLLLDGTARDKRRDRQCHMIGWQVDRVSPLDVIDLDNLVDELVAIYEERCRAVAA